MRSLSVTPRLHGSLQPMQRARIHRTWSAREPAASSRLLRLCGRVAPSGGFDVTRIMQRDIVAAVGLTRQVRPASCRVFRALRVPRHVARRGCMMRGALACGVGCLRQAA